MTKKAEATDRLIADLRELRRRRPVALVVEDDDAISATMRRLLERLGMDVTIDPTGHATTRLVTCAADCPDIVFLDLILPHSSGVEVLREIRRHCRHVPVVIVTGYPNSEQLIEASGLGYVGLIAKPALGIDAIREVLAKHHIGLPAAPLADTKATS